MSAVSKKSNPFHPRGSLYPLKGIAHFLYHFSYFSRPIAVPLTSGLLLSTATIIPLFRYGFRPQARAIELFLTHIAYRHSATASLRPSWLFAVVGGASALILCLAESYAVWNQFVGRIIRLLPSLLFDLTIEDHGLTHFEPFTEAPKEAVMRVRHTTSNSIMALYAADPLTCDRATRWRQILLRPVLLIASLPLNSIPILGTWFFLSFNGLPVAGIAHRSYFKEKGMSKDQVKRWIERRHRAYRSFGMLAVWLEMVPVIGILFACTNMIGAALWAVDEEHAIQEQKALALTGQDGEKTPAKPYVLE